MKSSKPGPSIVQPLSVFNHDRNAASLLYVYPVVSRRAGGVSIGINLNVNNACNWACVYCQVPGLVRGGPPPVDLGRLAEEISRMLDDIVAGDFLLRRAPEGKQKLVDVAFSGNGEPTASDQFLPSLEVVIAELERRGLAGHLPIRVITNGSLIHRPKVQQALKLLAGSAGEIWFKIDRASESAMQLVNQTAITLRQVERNLKIAAVLAPVWIQTCWFGLDGEPPPERELEAYAALIEKHRAIIRGVHLYGIARPSLQPGSERLQRLPVAFLADLADRLKQIGVTATVSE
jgi:wyosine [tRNA(Phe)-imidazoG37] synthetase (radical SAM superfamily)